MQLMVKIAASGNPAKEQVIADRIEQVVRELLDESTDGATFYIGKSGSGRWNHAFGFGRNGNGQDLEELVKQLARQAGVPVRAR